MTIIEGNKLIAEFMGWEKSPYPNTPDKLYRDDDKNEKQLSIHVSQLLYHSSWDWLMPVIKKFNDINPVPNFDEWDEWVDTINDRIEMNYDINEVFPAVVEAIKWYNENKTL